MPRAKGEVKRLIDESKAKGEVRVWVMGTRIHVTCPTTTEFETLAIRLRGRWRPRSGKWSFSTRCMGVIIAACNRIYGVNIRLDQVRSNY